jgi:hypothetical protein
LSHNETSAREGGQRAGGIASICYEKGALAQSILALPLGDLSGTISNKGEIAMNMKKLAVACLALVGFWFLFAVAAPSEAGETKTRVIKSKSSGTFVSANFDFDHPDLSTPGNYYNGDGNGNLGKFNIQGVNEFSPDGKKCTVPGGASGAGTEFTLVGNTGVTRSSANGDLEFFKGTSATVCEDFSSFPNPPFPFVESEAGIITGGTGAFSGASGTFTAEDKGATLSLDATGVRSVGWFQTEAVTTLTVPDSDSPGSLRR